MRTSIWLLVFSLVGCHSKEPSLLISANQLIGTWTSRSIAASEKAYTRWTFTSAYVYMVGDTVQACQPVDGNTDYNHPYKYWIDDNTLVMHYAGFTTANIVIPDIRWRISAIMPNEVVLDTPRQVLEKCP